MYHYRKLTPEQKTEAVQQRQLRGMPNHRPPRFGNTGGWFLITASTFEHKLYFNTDEDRTRLFDEIQKELEDVEILITAYLINILVACLYMQEAQNLNTIQHNIPNERLTVESLLTN